jgi:hypothetical protein
VPANNVLEDPGQHVVYAGAAVSGRRAFEEHELRAVLPFTLGAVKNVLVFPKLEHI